MKTNRLPLIVRFNSWYRDLCFAQATQATVDRKEQASSSGRAKKKAKQKMFMFRAYANLRSAKINEKPEVGKKQRLIGRFGIACREGLPKMRGFEWQSHIERKRKEMRNVEEDVFIFALSLSLCLAVFFMSIYFSNAFSNRNREKAGCSLHLTWRINCQTNDRKSANLSVHESTADDDVPSHQVKAKCTIQRKI